MTDIIKTDAIVLTKIDKGDTSRIITFYTEQFGKIAGMLRGAKSSKSGAGAIADVFNHLQIVYYHKPQRDIQLITQVELVNPFTKIKEELDNLKYGMLILETLLKLTLDNEENPRLFKSVIRALKLISEGTHPEEIVIRYLLFFIKELGYELELNNCISCNDGITRQKVFFNFERGIMCSSCGKDHLYHETLSVELFEILICLNHKNKQTAFSKQLFDKVIVLLERYLKYHNPGFSGFRSLGMA